MGVRVTKKNFEGVFGYLGVNLNIIEKVLDSNGL